MKTKEVIATIHLDGNLIAYDHLLLKQSYDWHHSFQISFENELTKDLLINKAKSYLGKLAKIELEEKDYDLTNKKSKKTNLFLGVITGIAQNRNGGNDDNLIFYGEGLTKTVSYTHLTLPTTPHV